MPAIAQAHIALWGAEAGDADTRRIARMLKKVSDARGLVAKSEVPGKTLDRLALLDRVKAHVAREVPKAAIRNEGLSMKLLGLLPTNFDYEAETYALLEAQLESLAASPALLHSTVSDLESWARHLRDDLKQRK